MTIILLSDSLEIRAEDNRTITEIVRLVDGTPLQWHTFTDTFVTVAGRRELLYELLTELTSMFFCKIEIV